MWTLIAKALLSGALIVAIAEIGKRQPALAALVASLPMFLMIPMLLRSGVNFWIALVAGCALTFALYLGMTAIGPRFGLRL